MTVQLDLTDAITDLLTADPSHTRERDAVIDAIRAAAVDGQVNPNTVRRLVPAWVGPKVVAATYRVLVHEGRLVKDGWTTSDDVRGRNAGRPVRVYRLAGGAW